MKILNLGVCRCRIEQTDTGTSQSSGLEIYLLLQNWNEDQSRTVPHPSRENKNNLREI